MSDWSDGFIGGLMVGSAIVGITYGCAANITKINISDAELYRFCMVKSIALPDCHIPKNPITTRSKDEAGK